MGLMEQFGQHQPSGLDTILALSNNSPRLLIDQLMQTNPGFARFCYENKDKTPEQAFREHGLDFEQFKALNPNR